MTKIFQKLNTQFLGNDKFQILEPRTFLLICDLKILPFCYKV